MCLGLSRGVEEARWVWGSQSGIEQSRWVLGSGYRTREDEFRGAGLGWSRAGVVEPKL